MLDLYLPNHQAARLLVAQFCSFMRLQACLLQVTRDEGAMLTSGVLLVQGEQCARLPDALLRQV